jgi:hypothetical protein
MPILMDEFHITIYAPDTLPPDQNDAIRQALDEPGFQAALRRAVRVVVRRNPPLVKVRVAVTR